jgi:hypothetical protein
MAEDRGLFGFSVSFSGKDTAPISPAALGDVDEINSGQTIDVAPSVVDTARVLAVEILDRQRVKRLAPALGRAGLQIPKE